ncbi:DoxX family protein [Undibacterium sp. TJN19]|uniref:DoxX family protein n=1 Tax=Undibacterium sp. TJN19 TaxID=3413055 RepID=UPI003BF364D7
MSQINFNSQNHIGLAIPRISLGIMWIAHAMLKYFVFGLAGTASYFASVGLPGMLAYPVFIIELSGGFALLVGFYGRQFALALSPILLGAAWVHFPNGWVHTSAGGGWEYPIFLSVISLAVWLLGDSVYALRRSTIFTLDA